MRTISQIGIVRRVEKEQAEIEIARASSCGEKCSSCNIGCSGTGMTVKLDNTINAGVGDRVKIESKASSIVYTALFVYLIPVIMMVVGMVYGSRLVRTSFPGISPDAAGLLFGVTALIIFYFLLKTVDNRLSAKNRNRLEITRILNR